MPLLRVEVVEERENLVFVPRAAVEQHDGGPFLCPRVGAWRTLPVRDDRACQNHRRLDPQHSRLSAKHIERYAKAPLRAFHYGTLYSKTVRRFDFRDHHQSRYRDGTSCALTSC